MMTIGEFITNQGELDIDNQLKESTQEYIKILKHKLEEDLPIKKVCQDLQYQYTILVENFIVWINSRSEEDMKKFNANIREIKLESKKLPELAKITSLCYSLNSKFSEEFRSPSGLQKLVNNPTIEAKLNKFKGEFNRQLFINSILIASSHFETCCVVSELILNGVVSKSPAWISKLSEYIQSTFVINIAILTHLGLNKLDIYETQYKPILNRVKMLKADIAEFGVQNYYHLIA